MTSVSRRGVVTRVSLLVFGPPGGDLTVGLPGSSFGLIQWELEGFNRYINWKTL